MANPWETKKSITPFIKWPANSPDLSPSDYRILGIIHTCTKCIQQATCWDTGWMQAQCTAWWVMLLINGENDCQGVLKQAIVTFNSSMQWILLLCHSSCYTTWHGEAKNSSPHCDNSWMWLKRANIAKLKQVISSSWDGRPFGHNRHGPKLGAVPLWGGGTGSPSNAMWPGIRSTSIPSFILIHPTVWPQ